MGCLAIKLWVITLVGGLGRASTYLLYLILPLLFLLAVLLSPAGIGALLSDFGGLWRYASRLLFLLAICLQVFNLYMLWFNRPPPVFLAWIGQRMRWMYEWGWKFGASIHTTVIPSTQQAIQRWQTDTYTKQIKARV